MSPKPVLLVLGAGSNIGKALASKFSTAGYQIALAARSIPDGTTPEGHLGIKVDLTDPTSIPSVFATVTKALGASPSTIIYNAASLTPPQDSSNIFSVPVDAFENDMRIMATSAFAAAKGAVAGFETLPKETQKSFIYTGNMLNRTILPYPSMVTLGVGKSAAAYFVGLAATTFAEKGYKFFYADERTAEGAPMMKGPGADSSAEFYFKLATEESNVPWEATFAEGTGYVDFSKKAA